MNILPGRSSKSFIFWILFYNLHSTMYVFRLSPNAAMPPASHVMDSGTGPDHHGSHPQLDAAATYQPVYSHGQLSSAGVMSHQQLGYSLMEQQQQLDLTQERMLMQVGYQGGRKQSCKQLLGGRDQ